MIVDFHSHTLESDGTLAPSQLIHAMAARGVSVYSITDHDSLAAYDAAAGALGKLVVGIEINTTYQGNEVHILGYGFAPDAPEVTQIAATNRAAREARAEKMVALLQAAGHDLTFEQVREEAGPRSALGRPHVAKALVRAKLTSSVEAAFRDLLGRGRPGYVPSSHIRPHEAIDAIVKAGGVPVLAHPGRLIDDELIDELAEAGIQGLEVFYPAHKPGQVAHFRERAKQHGLVMTAGSDFHDARWNSSGVGIDVDDSDIRPFLDLLGLT